MNIEFLDDLSVLSTDELEALNQDMGRHIDALREYRRRINAAYDEKRVQDKVWGAIKDIPGAEQFLELVERKDVVVTPDTVGMQAGILPLGG